MVNRNTMKYPIIYLTIICTLLLLFSNCQKSIERKIVYSDYEDYSLTILKMDNIIYMINGEYNSNHKPQNDFIQNKGGIEYYSGLINWTENATNIYTTYGMTQLKQRPE